MYSLTYNYTDIQEHWYITTPTLSNATQKTHYKNKHRDQSIAFINKKKKKTVRLNYVHDALNISKVFA